jgi:hypothetical protein
MGHNELSQTGILNIRKVEIKIKCQENKDDFMIMSGNLKRNLVYKRTIKLEGIFMINEYKGVSGSSL